jgi:uncharacterized protein (TIGR02147 family)
MSDIVCQNSDGSQEPAAMAESILEKIYEYDNYRFFLRDFFEEQKKSRAAFSHRYFARKAGFATSSFCAHVIEGKRNLTLKSLKKVTRGLAIKGRAATFFKYLVLYNQASTPRDKDLYFKKINRVRKSSAFYSVQKTQYAYYDEWYYPVIRELAVYSGWDGDYAALGSMVVPSLQPEKARRAVELLLDIGMLVKKGNGSFALPHEAVTAIDVPPAVTRKSRREFITLAQDAMEKLPVDSRHISGVTVLMSAEGFERIAAGFDALRENIIAEALKDDKKEKVFQFNFQAFPLSKAFAERKPL